MNSFDPNRWSQRRREDAWIARNTEKPSYRPTSNRSPYVVAAGLWTVIGFIWLLVS